MVYTAGVSHLGHTAGVQLLERRISVTTSSLRHDREQRQWGRTTCVEFSSDTVEHCLSLANAGWQACCWPSRSISRRPRIPLPFGLVTEQHRIILLQLNGRQRDKS